MRNENWVGRIEAIAGGCKPLVLDIVGSSPALPINKRLFLCFIAASWDERIESVCRIEVSPPDLGSGVRRFESYQAE